MAGSPEEQPMEPVAIVGLSALFPEAEDLRAFWENIVSGRDCIVDVPPSRWHLDDYYDPDPSAPDRTYCRRGGFVPDVDFDPLEWGLPPNSLEITDVAQLLSLVLAKRAFEDAGYGDGAREFDRERTAVVLGVGGGQKLITPLTSRLQEPVWRRALESSGVTGDLADLIVEKIAAAYVRWEEDSFPGLLGNVIAGRITNRFDLGGMNCVVDAACASSLRSTAHGARRADSGPCRHGSHGRGGRGQLGVHVPLLQQDAGILALESDPALRRGLRRDARRRGHRHARPQAAGGRRTRRRPRLRRDPRPRRLERRSLQEHLRAPRPRGRPERCAAPTRMQAWSRRASGSSRRTAPAPSPATCCELETLRGVLDGDGTEAAARIALGSVKSQIGHTKAAAGAAGLIKTALALHHKVLPPTINVDAAESGARAARARRSTSTPRPGPGFAARRTCRGARA